MEVYLDTTKSGQWSRHNATQRMGSSNYIAWTYLPSIVFVLYGILWQVIDGEIKRLEKYRQLAKDEQCTAAQSLGLNYHSFWAPLALFQALKYKQYSVVFSSTGLMLSGIVIPNLQNYVLTWDVYCGQDLAWGGQYCVQLAYADEYWSKCLIGALTATLGCALGLVWSLRKWRMDLVEDPRGLEFIVALTAFEDPNAPNALSLLQEKFPGSGITEPDLCVLKFEYFTDAGGVKTWPSLKFVRERQPKPRLSWPKIPSWISSNVELISLLFFNSFLGLTLGAAVFILVQMNTPKQDLLQDYQLPWSPNVYLLVGTFVQVRPVPFLLMHSKESSAEETYLRFTTVVLPGSRTPRPQCHCSLRLGDLRTPACSRPQRGLG